MTPAKRPGLWHFLTCKCDACGPLSFTGRVARWRLFNGWLKYGLSVQEMKETCMCGDYMEGHGYGSGHSPLSMWDYHAKNGDCLNEIQL